VEIDDEARAFRTSETQEVADTISHGVSLPRELLLTAGRSTSGDRCGDDRPAIVAVRFAGSEPAGLRVAVAQGDRAVRLVAAFAWIGSFPFRTPGKEVVPLQ
ncbi:MAG: hypothetical protein RLO48_18365, partial [Bauldia litoralis]